MTIVNFMPWPALVGGLLIGLATGLVLWLNGRIAGISGIVGRVLKPRAGDVAWRVWFLVGLVGGGGATIALYPPAAAGFHPVVGPGLAALAGLLVGFGARLGRGCTSGHGICGLARATPSGIAGTLIFMAIAFVTVWLLGGLERLA